MKIYCNNFGYLFLVEEKGDCFKILSIDGILEIIYEVEKVDFDNLVEENKLIYVGEL